MRLFKNVDLCDLQSILSKGILSLDDCGNNNWIGHRRANNVTDKVYLFSPINSENSFINYGIVLLEVDVEAEPSEMTDHDAYIGKYNEYICDIVKPEQIIAAYIPAIFKDKITFQNSKIKYVEISADWCNEDVVPWVTEKCSEEVLKRFAETANFECSNDYNFFRGMTEKRHMIDLKNLRYIMEKVNECSGNNND